VRAISNALSIGPGAIARSGGGLVEHARAQGWCQDAADLDLAGRYIDLERDAMSRGRLRCARATELLQRRAGRLEPFDLMAALRDHGAEGEAMAGDGGWHPDRSTTRSICMHAGAGLRRGQSVGSLVADLHPDRPAVVWVTGTSAPCLSVFKPVVLAAGLPDQGERPSERDDGGRSLWWRHEQFHRAAMLQDHAAVLAATAPERDALERRFAARIEAAEPSALTAAVAECWDEAAAAEARWLAALDRLPKRAPDAGYAARWTDPRPVLAAE